MTVFWKQSRRALLALAVAIGPMLAPAGGPFAPGLGGAAMASQLPVSPVALQVVTAKATHRFNIEIAADDATRAEGLMFRTSLAPDAGMLFDFKREQPVYFWMKNTYVSLDMIFVRADGTIARIAEATKPLSEAIVPSGEAVRFVLEVPAGTARRLGIAAGDRLVHPAIPAR